MHAVNSFQPKKKTFVENCDICECVVAALNSSQAVCVCICWTAQTTRIHADTRNVMETACESVMWAIKNGDLEQVKDLCDKQVSDTIHLNPLLSIMFSMVLCFCFFGAELRRKS